MGAREDLLAGAKRCLLEKGYAHTTARDIAAASGANLASINYHYGSKQALMSQALIDATSDWGDAVQEAIKAGMALGTDSLDRQEVAWQQAVELFDEHSKMWQAQFEALVGIDSNPGLRETLGAASPEARRGLVALFQGIAEEEVSEDDERVLGSFYMLLISGLMVQRAAGYDDALSGAELAEALRRAAR